MISRTGSSRVFALARMLDLVLVMVAQVMPEVARSEKSRVLGELVEKAWLNEKVSRLSGVITIEA